MIKGRLTEAIDNAGGLSSNQHGFRKKKSTITAIDQAITIVKRAWSGSYQARKACILRTFDVPNALNSVGWEDIQDALKIDFSID